MRNHQELQQFLESNVANMPFDKYIKEQNWEHAKGQWILNNIDDSSIREKKYAIHEMPNYLNL